MTLSADCMGSHDLSNWLKMNAERVCELISGSGCSWI